MTENELIDFLEDEISGLKDQRDGVIGEIAAEVFLEINGKERISKLRAIIGIITEIKQYRELGTVEELKTGKRYMKLAKMHGTIGQVIDKCAEYEKIGTVEDLREAADNTRAEKPTFYATNWYCPKCGNLVGNSEFCWTKEFCESCGKKIDFSNAYRRLEE